MFYGYNINCGYRLGCMKCFAAIMLASLIIVVSYRLGFLKCFVVIILAR